MRKLFLCLIMIAVLATLGCGGGGGGTTLPPASRDLSGLEGEWLVSLNYSINVKCDDGDKFTMADSTSGYYLITQNALIGDKPLPWSYDGSTLTFTTALSFSTWDYYCGNYWVTGNGHFRVPIQPGATFANITGTADIVMTSDYCGKCTGKGTYSGTMSKL